MMMMMIRNLKKIGLGV